MRSFATATSGRRLATMERTRVHFLSMKPEASLALEGRTIADKFVIESFIGQGAMGAVYRARRIALDKDVAIKVMNPDTRRTRRSPRDSSAKRRRRRGSITRTRCA